MESRSSKSNNNNVSEQDISQHTSDGVDYLSSMPQEILLRILYFLPLKYWIIMSVVSRQWKDLWTHISILNLDELDMVAHMIKGDVLCHLSGGFPSSSNPYQCLQHSVLAARRRFVEFADRVILFHSGCTIDYFRLSFQYSVQDEYTSRVDKWVHFAMTRNTKEIELNFSEGMPTNQYKREGLLVRLTNFPQPYKLRPHSFVSKTLKTLILIFCKFKASSFGQFVSLQRLSLMSVKVLDRSIGDLVSKCPALEYLSLESCIIPDKFLVCDQELKIKSFFLINCVTENWVMFPIQISTPDLLTLTIVGTYLTSSSVRKATKLVDVTIDIQQGVADHSQGNFLASLLIDFNHCQDLTLSAWCIQVLPTADSRLQRLPFAIKNVKNLRLMMGLVKQELPGVACLLRSCPNLESLIMDIDMPMNVNWDLFAERMPDVFDFEENSYMESQAPPFNCLQNCLKKVEMNGFVGISGELQMIKFLLRNASVLEIMNIYYYGLSKSAPRQQQIGYRWFQFSNMRRLMKFQKASPHAEVRVQKIQHCYLNIAN